MLRTQWAIHTCYTVTPPAAPRTALKVVPSWYRISVLTLSILDILAPDLWDLCFILASSGGETVWKLGLQPVVFWLPNRTYFLDAPYLPQLQEKELLCQGKPRWTPPAWLSLKRYEEWTLSSGLGKKLIFTEGAEELVSKVERAVTELGRRLPLTETFTTSSSSFNGFDPGPLGLHPQFEPLRSELIFPRADSHSPSLSGHILPSSSGMRLKKLTFLALCFSLGQWSSVFFLALKINCCNLNKSLPRIFIVDGKVETQKGWRSYSLKQPVDTSLEMDSSLPESRAKALKIILCCVSHVLSFGLLSTLLEGVSRRKPSLLPTCWSDGWKCSKEWRGWDTSLSVVLELRAARPPAI